MQDVGEYPIGLLIILWTGSVYLSRPSPTVLNFRCWLYM